MLPGKVATDSGGGWTGDLIIADWRDMENHVASEVHVKRFNSKSVGIKTLQDAFVFHCADVSLEQEGHAQRQTLRHPKVENFDAERTLDFDRLQSARGSTLQEEGVVANFF